jgi:hypothetical protein
MGAICSRKAYEEERAGGSSLPDAVAAASKTQEHPHHHHNNIMMSSPLQPPAAARRRSSSPTSSSSSSSSSANRRNGITSTAAHAHAHAPPKVFVTPSHEIEDLQTKRMLPELQEATPSSGTTWQQLEFNSYVNEDFSFEAAAAEVAATASCPPDAHNAQHQHVNTTNSEERGSRLSRMLSARASSVRSKTTNAAKKGASMVKCFIFFFPS